MASIETAFRHETAVYWEKTGKDNYGEVLIAEPVELRVRWVEKKEEVLDDNRNVIAVDANVVLAQDIVIGSIMWLGELTDFYGTGSGGVETQLMQVVALKRTPGLKRGRYRRIGYLAKFRDTMPIIGS